MNLFLCDATFIMLNKSVETMICFYAHLQRYYNMKFISEQMIRMLERLSEMFPDNDYQRRLDAYLNTKGITDAAQLEHYIQQFNSQKEKYL